MTNLADHPSVRRFHERAESDSTPLVLDAEELRQTCLAAGADDVGFVELERPELDDQRAAILQLLPRAQTLVALVVRMNRDNVRAPARSLANLEFHHTADATNELGRRIVAALERRGVRAINAAAVGFPMEMERWPGRTWTVAHKPVAVAAGLGRMGIHRNVIHPRFGSFVLLGTLALEARVSASSRPLDYNPCLECKLCVAACPTGALRPDGSFDFSACYTHNYREFMGGFGDWVENVVESRGWRDYRRRVSDSETVSLWQSLGFGPNYKAAYCLAVCPAGDEVIAPFLQDRARFLGEVVRPLQEKVETVYVVPGSDAEAYVGRRFPHKRRKRVGNGLRPATIDGFLSGALLRFQPGRARGLEATYHFTFTGDEPRQATIAIRAGAITVQSGHVGRADVSLRADSRTWLRLVARDASLLWALVRGRLRVRGSLRLLGAFARCFPG